MNVLWIFAHPEQRSLNAALRDEGLRTLDALGHRTRLSDLYAMGWNPWWTPRTTGRTPPTAPPGPLRGRFRSESGANDSSSRGSRSARTPTAP
ncbi:NAD(P)H-dependent oxidoreductase [Streptomyces sp. M19]